MYMKSEIKDCGSSGKCDGRAWAEVVILGLEVVVEVL